MDTMSRMLQSEFYAKRQLFTQMLCANLCVLLSFIQIHVRNFKQKGLRQCGLYRDEDGVNQDQ